MFVIGTSSNLIGSTNGSFSSGSATVLFVRPVTAVIVAVAVPQLRHAEVVVARELRPGVAHQGQARTSGRRCRASSVCVSFRLVVCAEASDVAVRLLVTFQSFNIYLY